MLYLPNYSCSDIDQLTKPESDHVTVAAIVLAAGAGSRFAGDDHKLVTEFRGRPLAAWAIEAALNSGCRQVYVVGGSVSLSPVLAWLGHPESPVDGQPELAFDIIRNDRWAEGQATSLGVGVERAGADGHDAVVVGLADQPFVGAACWAAVCADPAPIAVATFDGKPRPPVKLHSSVWPMLPTTGDEGARSLLKLRPDLVSKVACKGSPADVDTMEDLRKWS